MAIRSGTGTGVIVSLVVFVLTTVFLLVLCIVFYTNKIDQTLKTEEAKNDLQTFITSEEQNLDSFQTIFGIAKGQRRSVAGYLNSELESLKKFVSGSPSTSMNTINSDFANELSSGTSLKTAFNTLNTQLRESQQESKTRLAQLKSSDALVDSLQKQISDAVIATNRALESTREQWVGIQNKSNLLAENMNDHFAKRAQRDKRILGGKTTTIQDLKDERDNLIKEKYVLANDAADLREQVNSNRMSSVDPSLLVDGRILDVAGTDLVFIDLGSRDHIVLGMSFEIYDDASQLRVNEEGVLPRGKASIELIKVGESTSTAKITQSTMGQPIVRGNIIVNAIYDPMYTYKFMVHGQFDADGDGNPEYNNSFIKDRIENWGGIVVEDQPLIPGDLDFLVLGIQPEEPHPLPINASDIMINDNERKKTAYWAYSSLLEQAQDIKIPVLNANRLNILTGQPTH